jgi:hypothetical protein
MNRIILSLVITLLFPSLSISQMVFNLYQDDSLQNYFKDLGGDMGYYYNSNNLKDSLPDGTYFFYDVARKDSSSNKRNIIIMGHYLNSVKNGDFMTRTFFYEKKTKSFKPHVTQKCRYKDGKKNGVDEKFIHFSRNSTEYVTLIYYGEYNDGKKNGLFMNFEDGYPVDVTLYENDELVKVIINRKY